jgi:hypothetical protein
VRALVLADLAQQPIGGCVAGGALVQVVDLVILRRLTSRQQPVDRRDPRLKAHRQRKAHALRVGDGDPELLHPLLEPLPVAPLGLRHAPEDRCLAIGQPAGDQVIDRARDDLALPRLEQAIADLFGGLVHVG